MGKAGKNTHLEHLEDEIINEGSTGATAVLNILHHLRSFLSGDAGGSVSVTTKWDGAPAVICGTDPSDNQFFVGTKSVFAKDPKICKSENDINTLYSGQLAEKLKAALQYLKDAGIKGVLQGDLMFTNDKKTERIEGKQFITFRPNTITYAVESKSELGRKLNSCKLGIVFHTKYTGDSLATMTASFNVSRNDFSAPANVWIETAEFNDITGAASFTPQEATQFDAALRRAVGSFKKTKGILDRIQSGKKTLMIDTELKKFFNGYIKKGQSIPSVDRAYKEFFYHLGNENNVKIQGLKRLDSQADRAGKFMEQVDFILNNEKEFKMMIALYMNLQFCKNLIVDKMKKVSTTRLFVDKGTHYEATSPEGFVAIQSGKAVKLIDRLEFSKLNFTIEKNWG